MIELQRKLRVDDQRAMVAGEINDAVGPAVVLQRVLEGVGVLGQAVGDDRLHAPLAEGAARLLVGEHILERDHVGGELGEPRLCGVHHGKALVQLAEAFLGRARGVGDAVAETLGDLLQALAHRPCQIRVAAAQHFGERLHAAGAFRLHAQHLGDARFEIGGAARLLVGFAGARARRAPHPDRDEDEEDDGERGETKHKLAGPHRP